MQLLKIEVNGLLINEKKLKSNKTLYFGAGGTHVRCIYDGGILLEWNAEWKCMFKNWDPRKYKIERTLEPLL